MEQKHDVILIGAGPAGMMAAGTAAQMGKSVLLLEKNDKCGRKLAITGKGRCNVTNNSDNQNLMANIPVNGRFLYSAFAAFSSADTIDFFESRGCPLKTERGNRVFPVSDSAYSIVDTLVGYCKENGVKIKKANVGSLIIENGKITGVKTTDNRTFLCDNLILACGGCSYPATGSDGSGYILARQAGHTVTPIYPSLVPLTSNSPDCKRLAGLQLKNIDIKAVNITDNKTVYSQRGELLFTPYGISGPLTLSASSHMRKITPGKYTVYIDLKPALSYEKLDERILRDFSQGAGLNISQILTKLLPFAMIPVILDRCGMESSVKVGAITKQQRLNLAQNIKCFDIPISGYRPIDEAIITSGGVDVKEINPKTMESKLVKGLYFAGEIIDVDAHTGGYNLQIAFSTGHAAAMGVIYNSNE